MGGKWGAEQQGVYDVPVRVESEGHEWIRGSGVRRGRIDVPRDKRGLVKNLQWKGLFRGAVGSILSWEYQGPLRMGWTE